MDDDRTAEGVEHLQRAASELVAAARSFLDVVEDVIEDPDRFASTASSLVDLVRDGLGTLSEHRPDAPWAANAWTADTPTEDPLTQAAPTGVGPTEDWPTEDEPADEGPPDSARSKGTSSKGTPSNGGAGTARRSTQRVRRIAVD